MSDTNTYSALRQALLGWYHQARRRLPWRETPSLYATVLSEFMLQQTQVNTALPYFEAWLQRWPSFEALAHASEEDVLQAWQGLGYYSRARNLLKLAKAVATWEGVPTDAQSWKALPGVGDYTAAAITSIALGTPEACVDGNVVRIVTRLEADGTLYKDSGRAAKALKERCQALLDPDHPGDFNQAMMELGATVCRKQKPLCLLCPLKPYCKALAQGTPEAYPRLEPKVTTVHKVERLWCLHAGRLLLHQHAPDARRLAGFYELPLASMLATPRGPHLYTGKRGISNQRFEEAIYAAHAPRGTIEPPLHWVHLEALEGLPVSGPHRKWIQQLLEAP